MGKNESWRQDRRFVDAIGPELITSHKRMERREVARHLPHKHKRFLTSMAVLAFSALTVFAVAELDEHIEASKIDKLEIAGACQSELEAASEFLKVMDEAVGIDNEDNFVMMALRTAALNRERLGEQINACVPLGGFGSSFENTYQVCDARSKFAGSHPEVVFAARNLVNESLLTCLG